ncbi:DNA polymerase III subunit gamma/tau [Novosphingobium sp.]|uniref:DNA polymerase III subunit gamma/tau n=1 Tax=Novosphingobium sp. TaxID=1874826 RepID=UPI0022C1257B|nr:DNA polymerase III subunit gamma/tau [Novosphingobium sp.]MCZ8017487.1 DNA polymerase III subunit gamma/tau [Novosphingobium sp.]MCZ8033989.1 DNA polymerase III subunit gamma/tau [Novosphingobium sp.]MCZ8051345.1 DNA polymerase III subunit gamma/tau [Novosphingobium sp.]MCZ8059691.1 DNA polymerase III subunit gamma/tau [Novosphingobium sp.]MCZ8231529.1 DNA polymerase III subunit gamma/tau [Novosphingobium sp.]
MDDSPDIFGDEPQDDGPSAAELEAAGQESMFGAPAQAPAPLAAPAPVAAAQPYRVLARKYRSQTFAELIGQDAMVQTLANAIKRDRLAHAFLMTGIRGVGKTSTARLIAKALNCVGPDGQGGPTIDPCGQCEPCVAIAEGRHIDVIEMDAASHTGVDDVREIIEAVRYAAVSARYKIYIIDEVHMLSRNAFNALLKTLEEPPPHVKFLFATTEVDKLPVTVLSRCQRFDLKRIPAELLAEHFAMICGKEGVEAEAEALAMIAAAADGSVRDGLSILDQAIAHADLGGDGRVTAAQVQDMLGLADKTAQRRLFGAIVSGDAAGLLDLVDQQFALGVEPHALLRGALELTHRVTLAQLGRDETSFSNEERAAIEDWAQRLSAGQLHRLWQLLLKGHDEVRTAPDPLVAARMALLRVLHASDLPDPGKLADTLRDLLAQAPAAAVASAGGTAPSGGPAASAPPPALDWEALIDRVDQSGQLRVAQTMRDWVRVIDLRPGELTYSLVPGFSGELGADLRDALLRATGERWTVQRGEGEGRPSLREAAEAIKAAEDAALRQHPLVQAAFAAFPQAEIIDDKPAALSGGKQWSKTA